VVQAPVPPPNFDNTFSSIPVKRFSGEEDNSVCFLPVTDIDKDSSNIYDKARVSKSTSWIEAHGVTLFDSAPDEELEYRCGDCFWICVGPDTNKYQTIVPVINLRTFEDGDIPVDRVCWYPKIKGPNNEF
jgi:hypothetical protein